MYHTASEQLYKVRPGDIIWIVTVRPPGHLTVVGRVEVGECTNREAAMERLGTKDVWDAKYHVIAKPGTEELLREVNIANIAEDLRFESSHNRLNVINGGVNGRQLQAMRLLTSASAALVEAEWYGSDVQEISEVKQHISVGAGFGTTEMNRKVMEAAVTFVYEWYAARGWDVQSVEAERRGYDLLCMKNSTEEYVEVKGVKGTVPSFIITAGEVRQARTNPQFILCVVTSALSDTPQMFRYTGWEFAQKFRLKELAYQASLLKESNTDCSPKSGGDDRYPLRGQPLKYVEPMESVAEDEWGALR